MVATAKEQSAVDDLTDKAIAAEIAKLERMMNTREMQIDDLQDENRGYAERCAVLRRAQIQRIEAKLPTKPENGD